MVRVPRMHPELSTERLLTMQWLDGEKLLSFKSEPQEVRKPAGHRHVQGMVAAFLEIRRHPRRPASRQLQRVRQGQRA